MADRLEANTNRVGPPNFKFGMFNKATFPKPVESIRDSAGKQGPWLKTCP